MEKKRMPPVPPASRSTKGPGSDPDTKLDNPVAEDAENIDEAGDRANVRQNTTNQQHNR